MNLYYILKSILWNTYYIRLDINILLYYIIIYVSIIEVSTSKIVIEKVSILQQFCSNKFDTSKSEFEQVSILHKVSSFTALIQSIMFTNNIFGL